MINEIIVILSARMNTLACMIADDAKSLAFSDDNFREKLIIMQKDYDTLRMLTEIAFEIINLEDRSE